MFRNYLPQKHCLSFAKRASLRFRPSQPGYESPADLPDRPIAQKRRVAATEAGFLVRSLGGCSSLMRSLRFRHPLLGKSADQPAKTLCGAGSSRPSVVA